MARNTVAVPVVITETPEFKALVLQFQAQAQAQADAIRKAGATLSTGERLSYKELLVFVQVTLGVTDENTPESVHKPVLEARAALGSIMPTKNKWKSLQALIEQA